MQQQSAEALFSALHNRGVQLELKGEDRLAVWPPSKLSDDDRQTIRALKQDLLAPSQEFVAGLGCRQPAPSGESEVAANRPPEELHATRYPPAGCP